MPVLTPPKRRSPNHADPPIRPPRPRGRVARDRYPAWWSLLLLALLCAVLAGLTATRAHQPLPWVVLTVGFVAYAAAIGYRGIRKR